MTLSHEQVIAEAVKLVNEGLNVTLPVKGRSMLPFIIGDRDSVVLCSPPPPAIGDVVLAWVDGCRYVIHRIIATDGDAVTLMGDGNLTTIERCSATDIKAIATHTVDPRGRRHPLYTWWRRRAARLWRRRFLRRLLLPVFNRCVN